MGNYTLVCHGDSVLVVSRGYFVLRSYFSSGEAVQMWVLREELQAEELAGGAQGALPHLLAEHRRVRGWWVYHIAVGLSFLLHYSALKRASGKLLTQAWEQFLLQVFSVT